MTCYRLSVSALLLIFCVLFRTWLERDPVTHVLIQLPLLAWSGMLLVQHQITFSATWNRGGVAALLTALFVISFWMLPRSIDASLTSSATEIAKFISIPILVGVPLAIGWSQAHPLLRGFLKAQAISMLGVMAFLYTHSPIRLCNAYLVNDQERLGFGFLIIAFGLAICWTIPLFGTHKNSRPINGTTSIAAGLFGK